MTFYLYDNTFEGFLTAVFTAYADKEAYITGETVQLGLEDSTMSVITEENKAARVLKKLREYDKKAESEIYAILKSNLADKAQRAYRYIRIILKVKAPAQKMLANAHVLDAMDAVQKVWSEVHLMKGLLRFMEMQNGVLYAPFTPDNDITEYLIPHFVARFSKISFIIHDTKRKIAGLYNQKDTALVPLDKSDIFLSDTENAFCALWKGYYDAVNIPERKRLKQMKGYMPVRYWKFLPEKRF